MAHFYLTLPSNSSMNYYPKNTLTRYTTKLVNAISLSGDWEVGLVEIQYPHSWFNLKRGEGRITYANNLASMDKPIQLQSGTRLLSGYYETPTELVKAVNNCLQEYAEKNKHVTIPNFNYNPTTKRVYAFIDKDTAIYFSPALCNMLGIDRHQNPIVNDGDQTRR